MKRWVGVTVLSWLLAAQAGRGQVSVSVQLSDEIYVLYEPIAATVSIRNVSARTMELTTAPDQAPWLTFWILDDNGRQVEELKPVPVGASTLLPAGDTVSRTFNLTPLYDLRNRGAYKLRAQINSGAIDVASPTVRFTILNGQEIWAQTVSLGGPAGEAEVFRTYSLIVKRGPRYNHLYAGVRDDPNGLVYGMLALGHFVPVTEPQMQVDRQGHLHTLYRSSARSLSYHHIDPSGRIVEQDAYADIQSFPRLVVDSDGRVSVRGGEKAVPYTERVMTEEELQPPPPPPPPKKKWWQSKPKKPAS